MGDDLRVVNAARVSFDKESEWDGCEYGGKDEHGSFAIPTLSDKDKKLILYLARNNHWTPFSHCTITLRETVPIFVARQRFKHTVGFSYNEVSRRYVDDVPKFYYPAGWRKRADDKKQGSSDQLVYDIDLFGSGTVTIKNQYEQHLIHSLGLYNDLIRSGIAPEQARMVLPQSMYTSYYVTGSLSAWARAYNLRTDEHAQKEIQELAKQWDTVISPFFPESWKALTSK
jgi:thymidylate synthase (FAD)